MNCPKCGVENPDGSQICSNCSYVFTDSDSEQQEQKTKVSIMAFSSALLSATAIGLALIFKPIIALIFALLGIGTAISSIKKIKNSKRKTIGKSFAIVAIVFSSIQIVLLSYWLIDAPPIPNDYTLADLRSAPSECAGSYELLMSISKKGYSPDAPLIGLSAQDVNTIKQVNEAFAEGDYLEIANVLRENAENIKQAWINGKKGRDIINKLNTFPEIADLTEPDLEADIGFLRNIRLLICLCQAYVCLENQEGNSQNAIAELIKSDSVFRKLSINARSTITKLVCIGCSHINIRAANFIINNPQTPKESLYVLSDHFKDFTKEQVSLRNSMIFEYLSAKNMLTKIFNEGKLKYSALPPFKFNSTLRLLRNHFNDLITYTKVDTNLPKEEKLSVWPSIYPDLPVQMDPNGKIPWFYKAYNPIGSMLSGTLLPTFGRVFELNTQMLIHHDLLQIILNKRLGKEVSLKARAYSDEYIIDVEKKMIFSPGPDGKAYTDDDIKLIINPEALGLLQK